MRKIISTVLVCVLLLGCIFTLCSCGAPDSDPKTAKENLEDEGYDVTFRENYEGYAATIYARNDNVNEKEFNEIFIYYYNDENAANEAWKTLEDKFAKEAKTKEGTDYEIKYGIDGKVIYKGTVDAVKAAG